MPALTIFFGVAQVLSRHEGAKTLLDVMDKGLADEASVFLLRAGVGAAAVKENNILQRSSRRYAEGKWRFWAWRGRCPVALPPSLAMASVAVSCRGLPRFFLPFALVPSIQCWPALLLLFFKCLALAVHAGLGSAVVVPFSFVCF